MKCNAKILGCLLLASLWLPAASATSLLVSEAQGTFLYGYGSSTWDEMTATLDDVFDTVDVVPDFTNLEQMLSYDRIWLDQRYQGSTLQQVEVDNIAAFVATGRRVVLMGEREGWTDWNNQILGIGGGTFDYRYYGYTSPILAHSITHSVSSVMLDMAGTAIGGTELFDVNFATLWCPQQNMLTVLDINVWDDNHWNTADDAQFAKNVADWLVAPEPGSLSLLAVAALLLRRRR
ncbi:MAG: hypothetical protein PVJ57_19050 [Phycisphaerae bacterium]|jgi:hypothetical protein